MGLLKKIAKKVSSNVKATISQPGKVLEKSAKVAVAGGTGFLTGGGIGGTAAALRETHRQGATSDGEALNLRSVTQAGVTGAVANVASAVVLKGGAFVAAKGGAGALLKAGGGKLLALGKGGGLIQKGVGLAKGLLSKGGGGEEAPGGSAADADGGSSFFADAGAFVSSKGKQLLSSPAAKDAFSKIKKSVGLPGSGTDDAALESGANGGTARTGTFQAGLGGFGTSGTPTWLVVAGLVGSFIFAFAFSKRED